VDGVDEMDVRRFRKSYCFVVVMRPTPLFVKANWLTKGEFATYV